MSDVKVQEVEVFMRSRLSAAGRMNQVSKNVYIYIYEFLKQHRVMYMARGKRRSARMTLFAKEFLINISSKVRYRYVEYKIIFATSHCRK